MQLRLTVATGWFGILVKVSQQYLQKDWLSRNINKVKLDLFISVFLRNSATAPAKLLV